MTIEEKNIAIAEMLGWKYYPKVKTTTYYYEYELHKLNELDEDDLWIIEPTEEFEKHLCVSSLYYEMENLNKPYKEFHYNLKFHSDANWQFDVIDYLMENKHTSFNILHYRKRVNVVLRDISNPDHIIMIDREDNNRKEAIFEALYQFSQYIKNK